MPKVFVNKHQYKVESIGSWIVGQLFKKRLKRGELSKALDITRQGLDWKLQHNSFDYGDLLTIFEFLGSSEDEILFVMKLAI